MRSHRTGSNKSATPTRIVGAAVGSGAIVAMAAFALHTNAMGAGNPAISGAGSMQTGVTTSSTVAASNLATSMAVPSIKATPHWGQPPEP
jgi:hypothetical protein